MPGGGNERGILMTNTQLYLVIGVSVLINSGVTLGMFALFNSRLNKRIDDFEDLWRAELRRALAGHTESGSSRLRDR